MKRKSTKEIYQVTGGCFHLFRASPTSIPLVRRRHAGPIYSGRHQGKPAEATSIVGRCGVVGSTLAFRSIGHGFESEHRLFSHNGASAGA